MSKKQIPFIKKYGPWALVTGGAMGIGAEFCTQLAERGINLVILDKEEKEMLEHARSLEDRFNVEVITVHADLADPGFMTKLRKAAKGREIGLLVNNAAWGTLGEFIKADVDEMERTIAVNCRAPMVLTREYGPAMAERGRGGIIILSSCAAMHVTPVIANYAASKAFDLVLAEALWDELRPYGVDVLAVCPGATDTPALRSTEPHFENVPGMPVMQTGPVVSQALKNLGREPRVISGRMNSISTFILTKFLTNKKRISFTGKYTRKLYPDK